MGAVIAGLGFAVYAEFASAMPQNGGELNYLRKAYNKPKSLVAAMYAGQALLLGHGASNAYAAGRYFLKAGDTTSEWKAKGIAIAIFMSALFLHGGALRWGLHFQNALCSIKLVVLVLIAFSGFAALAGHTKVPTPHNFTNAFAGTRSDVYGVSNCLYNATWGYIGYSNAFYALGEVRNPRRLIRIAGPLSILIIAIIYMLVQVAYFAAVPKEDIAKSTQVVAAYYFQNMFGVNARKALSVFVALSATGNVFTVVFANGRLTQGLGRDDLVPFSRFFASNRPFKTPLAGLAMSVAMALILLLAPPQGDIYNFLLVVASYPLNVVNAAVGFALVAAYLPLRWRPQWAHDWEPPFRCHWITALAFALVSTFLTVAPWVPPRTKKDAVYVHLWYGIGPAVGLGFFLVGAAWWVIRWKLLPALGGYRLEEQRHELSDGTFVRRFVKVY